MLIGHLYHCSIWFRRPFSTEGVAESFRSNDRRLSYAHPQPFMSLRKPEDLVAPPMYFLLRKTHGTDRLPLKRIHWAARAPSSHDNTCISRHGLGEVEGLLFSSRISLHSFSRTSMTCEQKVHSRFVKTVILPIPMFLRVCECLCLCVKFVLLF